MHTAMEQQMKDEKRCLSEQVGADITATPTAIVAEVSEKGG